MITKSPAWIIPVIADLRKFPICLRIAVQLHQQGLTWEMAVKLFQHEDYRCTNQADLNTIINYIRDIEIGVQPIPRQLQRLVVQERW